MQAFSLFFLGSYSQDPQYTVDGCFERFVPNVIFRFEFRIIIFH